jgi:hypothetical protein
MFFIIPITLIMLTISEYIMHLNLLIFLLLNGIKGKNYVLIDIGNVY